ncbi:MAG: response regulator [Ginsengibacter sp.]
MSNILVIDNDLEILEVVGLLLTKKGLNVRTESKWKETFYEIESFVPDIILLDIDLGDGDGRIISRQLKLANSTCNIPVILFSGISEMNNNLGDCLNDDFIAKPFDPKTLFDKIEYFLLKIYKLKKFEKDHAMLQMMESDPVISFDYLYNKYAASLFGYILSLVKDKQKSEILMAKVFTELANNPKNFYKDSLLLQCIKIANRSMIQNMQTERQTFLAVFNNYKGIRNS